MPRRLALVEVAAQPDVAVGQREDRLRLGEQVEVQRALGDRPGVDLEAAGAPHAISSRASCGGTITGEVAPATGRAPRIHDAAAAMRHATIANVNAACSPL